MSRSVILFAIITLIPLPLLVGAVVFGGWWSVLAFTYLSVFTLALDEIVAFAANPKEPAAEFPAANQLSVILAVAHFPLMVLAIWGLAASGLAMWERVLVFFAYGLFFGQVSNSNAHELIHRGGKRLHLLGMWVYISMLFGHHASAHPKVHHRYVASDQDPNSARSGESYYRFAMRAWIGSFRAGLAAETKLWNTTSDSRWQHPYVIYVAGALGFCILVSGIGGQTALFAYIALASYGTAQLLLSDYVQHYGLRRKTLPNGKLEPVNNGHSWNAPHWFSSYLMLSAPRHSDHHAHPSKPFSTLIIPEDADTPILPHSLPAMGFVALFPNWWRRVMDPLVNEQNT